MATRLKVSKYLGRLKLESDIVEFSPRVSHPQHQVDGSLVVRNIFFRGEQLDGKRDDETSRAKTVIDQCLFYNSVLLLLFADK